VMDVTVIRLVGDRPEQATERARVAEHVAQPAQPAGRLLTGCPERLIDEVGRRLEHEEAGDDGDRHGQELVERLPRPLGRTSPQPVARSGLRRHENA
jgi:hypothetical protein